MKNIVYLLFLDLVEWFSLENGHQMRYTQEVKQFWKVGGKLFKGNFLRFMGGWKNQGQASLGNFHPSASSVNFIVPDRKPWRGKIMFIRKRARHLRRHDYGHFKR